jgi:hypothetical protein
VRQAIPKEIAVTSWKELRLSLQASEGGGVYEASVIPPPATAVFLFLVDIVWRPNDSFAIFRAIKDVRHEP